MARRRSFSQKETLPFEVPPSKSVYTPTGSKKGFTLPVWTHNKAKLVERYLGYFQIITKHGTYIDGFAGPQWPDNPDSWAAKLAVEMEPKWFRHFHLFDNDPAQVRLLRELPVAQPDRDIRVYPLDFNRGIQTLLDTGDIGEKEAVFCLVDQRTFECDWETLETIARYQRPRRRKIELFYFLPNSWFGRSVAAMHKDTRMETLSRSWGRSDWQDFVALGRLSRCQAFAERLRTDLDYAFVDPYPIRAQDDAGSIMYYMLHASDHPDAPKLMARAYRNAVLPPEARNQLSLGFPGSPAS